MILAAILKIQDGRHKLDEKWNNRFLDSVHTIVYRNV